MWEKPSLLRVVAPTILVSLLLFAACTASGLMMYRYQAMAARSLEEDVSSRRVAFEIVTTLKNLIDLLQDGSDQVEALNERIEQLLAEARGLANREEETRLERELTASFQRYHEGWLNRTGSAAPERVRAAVRHLEGETLVIARRLSEFNAHAIEQSEQDLRGTMRWLAWGLVAVGIGGSLAGVVLGFGVARAVRRSFHQLSVHVRDAADKLRQELPTVTLTGGDGGDLHEQMQELVAQVALVVERLQQREREVLRAEQMSAVGQLAAGVAHELRNPLTAIKMLVQASREDMEQRGLPAEDLGTIEQEIRRLEKCLQTFLDFARPPKTEWHRVDLGALVEQTYALLGGRAGKQRVALKFTPPPEPVVIEGDGEQLRQVLINLALNALDAMPRGGTLEITLSAGRDGQVEVRVLDSGPGIAEEVFPRLFEPFVSGKETGLGLGLVVSRRIVEAHGGTLRGSNRPQGGACFAFRLPAHRTES